MGNSCLAVAAVLPLLIPASYSQSQASPVLTTLHNFTGLRADGANPETALAIGPTGALHGVTYAGGCSNRGTVFELAPQTGGSWRESVLHSFAGVNTDGSGPTGGLIIAQNGVLFGTTRYGGTVSSACNTGCGTVFALLPPAVRGGTWTESVLYRF